MDLDHVDVVIHEVSGDVVPFMSRDTAHALAFLLHLVDDDPDARLSPRLKPLMCALDEKLIGYPERAWGKRLGIISARRQRMRATNTGTSGGSSGGSSGTGTGTGTGGTGTGTGTGGGSTSGGSTGGSTSGGTGR